MNIRSRRSSIVLFILLSAPFQLFSQTAKGFDITGHLNGFKSGEEVLVKLYNRFDDWHLPTWMDSCMIVNGNFHLKGGPVPEGPRSYEIYFFKGVNGHSSSDPAFEPHGINFLIDNGDAISVHGNIDQIKINNISISGSQSNDAQLWAQSLGDYAYKCYKRTQLRLRKIKDSIGYDRKLIEEQINEKQNLDKYLDSVTQKYFDSVTKNSLPASEIGIPSLITILHDWLGIYHGYFQKDLYAKLPPIVQNSYIGKIARNMAALSIGQPFPDFSFPTSEGNMITLKDFLHKGKITLVHFWGTTSFERERCQNDLKVMYNKFHDKGLNVIGVSADTTKEDWEFMVHLKKYPWVNVIAEPKGWGEGSVINDVYLEGGHTIPNTTNVLLDDKGFILAWDVEGPELQYYLGKYLGE